MVMGDVYAWILSFFLVIALMIILVYQFMCLVDLEFDYINPYDSANRINSVVLPEFVTQGVLCLLHLLTGHWFVLLLCLPYLYYNVRMYMQRQHLVDVTEIFNLLNWEKKKRIFKLVYLTLLFLLSDGMDFIGGPRLIRHCCLHRFISLQSLPVCPDVATVILNGGREFKSRWVFNPGIQDKPPSFLFFIFYFWWEITFNGCGIH
ncbi:hypothetical protein HHK36_001026 [Tetracentron sinense]|uniref:Cornichon n=1 Tax=Tetracentron sinense TaxID=13715 RepID=A0A834ZWX0_TETSI|nr:hypothetical protein HHK36_001026 [Tetracentron sinense]